MKSSNSFYPNFHNSFSLHPSLLIPHISLFTFHSLFFILYSLFFIPPSLLFTYILM
ncbi:hypothetical protein HMPREF1870_01805 [Bacteroidales bacterium KA00344]|nr:hypothetical protein HMPREF1870_01805 [Bacteroidales bacterium KA00344]